MTGGNQEENKNAGDKVRSAGKRQRQYDFLPIHSKLNLYYKQKQINIIRWTFCMLILLHAACSATSCQTLWTLVTEPTELLVFEWSVNTARHATTLPRGSKLTAEQAGLVRTGLCQLKPNGVELWIQQRPQVMCESSEKPQKHQLWVCIWKMMLPS